MKKILCWFGIHDWDLQFPPDSLYGSWEECKRCHKKRSGWLR